MLTPRRRAILAVPGLAALLLGLGVAAGPAHAATAAAAPRTVSAAGIFGPCNRLEDGEVRDFGGYLYECKYIPGFGGFYWYGPVDESCAAPALVLAGKTETLIC
jgi:hypothetical protein